MTCHLHTVTYGPVAANNLEILSQALTQSKATLSYDSDTKQFTILNSQDIEKEDLKSLFKQIPFYTWAPELQYKPDEKGNKIFTMVDVSDIYKDDRASLLNRLASKL
jgi:hypothetical protein